MRCALGGDAAETWTVGRAELLVAEPSPATDAPVVLAFFRVSSSYLCHPHLHSHVKAQLWDLCWQQDISSLLHHVTNSGLIIFSDDVSADIV
jgi:hypothetical protein